MKNLPIQAFTGSLQNQPVQLINARELHQFLQVGKDFSTWIKDRISNYGFQENLDFSPISGKSTKFFGRPTIEYHITLDMAKELCMLERSELGRQARRYFIEQEKKAKQLAQQNAELLAKIPPFVLSNPNQTLQLVEKAQLALFTAYPECKTIIRYRDMGLNNGEIATLMGITRSLLERRLKTMFSLGLLVRKQQNQFTQNQLALSFTA